MSQMDARPPGMDGGHSPAMVQIRFVDADGATWKSDPFGAPYDFAALFQCVNNPTGVCREYRSTEPIHGKDWWLTHAHQGNTHGWAMFARTAGEHWDKYKHIGVEAGHPMRDQTWIAWDAAQTEDFPLATDWWDRKNGRIRVDIRHVPA